MPNHTETRKDEARAAPTGSVTKAFLVGFCVAGIDTVFAEAAITTTGAADNGTLHLPVMDDSRDGLRFVGRDGREHVNYIPTITMCFPGALAEVKKYLYGVPVEWVPQGIDAGQLTRDRDCTSPLEGGLEGFLRANGVRPDISAAMSLNF
ncbi:hypothetical protein ANO14919_131180 [Xylariales sp. No.14919]|nr:hypothetical protein ANO14919_131180 [Xylariales sp. No.14919]